MSRAPMKYGFVRRLFWIFTANPDFHKAVGPAAAQRLSIFWKYAKVELRPPGPSDFPKAMSQLGEASRSIMSGKFLQLTPREVTVRSLTLLDVVICFFIGEIIGKGCISGYQVPGGANFRYALKGEIDNNTIPGYREGLEKSIRELEEQSLEFEKKLGKKS